MSSLADGGAAARLHEIDRPGCLALLAGGEFGRLVVTAPTGRPLIRPVNYAFDEPSQSVIFRTDPGVKLSALLHHARASFEIDSFDAARGEGWSVIITGVTEPITHPHELARLERQGIGAQLAEGRAHWIRIRARTVSGRRLGRRPAA